MLSKLSQAENITEGETTGSDFLGYITSRRNIYTFVDNVGTSAAHALPDDTVGFETPRIPLDLGFKCQEVGVGRAQAQDHRCAL